MGGAMGCRSLFFASFWLVVVVAAHTVSAQNENDCRATELTETPLHVTWKPAAELRTFHYSAQEDLAMWLPFADVYLNVSSEFKDELEIYQGANCSEVLKKAAEGRSFFSIPRWNYKPEQWLSPYQSTYVGVLTDKPYSISYTMHHVNLLRVIGFGVALLMFFNARRLVRNPLAFYSGGLTLGTLTSVLLLLIVLYRFVPKRFFRLPFIFGWTVSAYLYYKAWENFGQLATQYRNYVLVYLGVALCASFAVCYRLGPPRDARTLNLLQWLLQGLSLLLLYVTCQYKELSITVIALLIWWPVARRLYVVLRRTLTAIASFVRGPQPRRLLTEDEYQREAVFYTKREIEKLRNYCRNSPGSDSWMNVTKLSEPKRMSSFILGDTDHVTPEEESSYMETMTDDEMLSSDDEDFRKDDDISEDNDRLSEC